MPQKPNASIENEDSFAELPSMKTNSFRSRGESVKADTQSKSQKDKVETGTKGYIVKKITSTHTSIQKQDTKTTRLGTVSIDTDTQNPNKNANELNQKINRTSIETGEFTKSTLSKQDRYPLIIDETENVSENRDTTTPLPQLKKEKVQPPQNISLDISSEFFNPSMPSGTTQEQLGSGKIVGVLGSGGMARVYKTWNEKLEIYRAVKILLPSNQQETWDRFLTEAKITAKLHHPNIIETYDTGEWHGLPFIEMELIEGDTLNNIISKHHLLPSPVCCAIALEISKALAYAHGQQILIYGKTYNGIIHRDLKPSNIMVTSAGIVKLMDFGVARPIETGFHTIATDSIVGTMHYFSPEQINGYPVDPLSDVYSFGAVLYEMLCGINPFPQNNMVNLIQAKTKNQFERLEDFHLKIDHRLAAVTQTCLRTDKRERYENFSIIRKTLEEIHMSYGMGSAEEVINNFYSNPDSIRAKFDQFYETRQKKLAENTVKPNPPAIREVLIENKEPEIVKNDTVPIAPVKNTWEKEANSHHIHVIIIIALLLIIVIASGVVFRENIFGNNTVKQKVELINNTLKGKLIDAGKK